MRAVDVIVKKIHDLGLSQKKAAEMCGMSRQALWQLLDRGNPEFQTMTKIMEAFGFQICLIDEETGLLRSEAETKDLVDACQKGNIHYDDVVGILGAVGIIVDLEENPPKK